VTEIHQALHGYSDGHRLLAASCRLPREAQRALLILSDISGPVTAGAFESYLTGCPLPGAGAYALSRTWLATELNRPGCVWTHTLLVDYAELARIPDLGALCALFRRPRRGEPRQDYSRTATLPPASSGDAPPARLTVTERDIGRVLAALYGVPDAPTFLVADRADRLESLVLALWSQQWPRLRRALGFCTWALTIRSMEGEALDLQVVPPSVYRQVRERQPKFVGVNLGGRSMPDAEPARVPSWAPAAARDLVGDSGQGFRQVLWMFGTEGSPSRAAFSPLAEIADQVAMVREGRLAVTDLVESVTAHFPGPGDGSHLKVALFGEPTGDPETPLPELGEPEVLEALATTSRASALDSEALALGRRAVALWNTDRAAALALAGRLIDPGPLTPLGERLLRAVAGVISPAEASGLSERAPRLLAALVERNGGLARPGAPRSAAPAPAAPPAPAAAPVLVPPPAPAALPAPAARPAPPVPPVPPVPPAPAAPPPAPPKAPAPQVPEPLSRVPSPAARPAAGPESPLAAVAPRAPSAAPPAGTVPRPREPSTVADVLDWLNDQAASYRVQDLPPAWRALLESRTSQVLGWLVSTEAPGLAALAAAASVLDPAAPEVRRAGPSPWLRAIATIENSLDAPAHAELMAFLLALALESPGPGADELATRAFDPVDRALAAEELAPAAWERLGRHLPTVPWWREWDRSERLRRGFVDSCLRHRWPAEALLRATRDDDTFQRLVVICEWTRDGQELLKRLAAQVGRGQVPTTNPRRSVLSVYR
jgi:hypothetical protein